MESITPSQSAFNAINLKLLTARNLWRYIKPGLIVNRPVTSSLLYFNTLGAQIYIALASADHRSGRGYKLSL